MGMPISPIDPTVPTPYSKGARPTVIKPYVRPKSLADINVQYEPKAGPTVPTTSSNPKFVDSQNEYALNGPVSTKTPSPVRGGNSGSGNNVSSGLMATPVDPNAATNDLLDQLYSGLTSQITETGGKNAGLYDAALKAIEANYAKTGEDRYMQYSGSRKTLAEGANNLGVNLDTSSIGKGYDSALRRIEEMSNSNLNSDQSYLEKMKALDQQGIASLLTGVQQELVNRKATEAANLLSSKSGGGSGRGGSGSGKNSGKVSTTATDTSSSINVGDKATYDELLRTDPKTAQLYLDLYLAADASPVKAANLANSQKTPFDINTVNRIYNSNMNTPYGKTYKPGQKSMYLTPAEQKTNNAKKNAPYNKVIQAFLGISNILGNNNTKNTVTQKASQKK